MSYHKIIFSIVSLGTVLGGIFFPITIFSQASDIAANTTANQKSSSGSGSPVPNTASSPDRLDKFGIKEIYPTMQGGREWYINMSNPRNDNIFSIGTGFSYENIKDRKSVG